MMWLKKYFGHKKGGSADVGERVLCATLTGARSCPDVHYFFGEIWLAIGPKGIIALFNTKLFAAVLPILALDRFAIHHLTLERRASVSICSVVFQCVCVLRLSRNMILRHLRL